MNQLGSSLRSLGEYAEAEVLHRRELSAKRELYAQDPGNDDIVDGLVLAIRNVANTLRAQGEYEDAERLLQEALELGTNVHGTKHSLHWLTMESLAIVCGVLKKYDEAHKLFDELLIYRREAFGESHYSILITRGQYMSLLSLEGKYALAEQEGRSLLQDEISLFGYGSQTQSTMHNLGIALHQQKKYTEAEQVFKKLLEHQETSSTTSKQHRRGTSARIGTTASSSRQLVAVCLKAQGRDIESQEYEVSPPSSREIEDGMQEARELKDKSHKLFNQRQFQECEATSRQELEVRMQHAGLDDPETQTCHLEIAKAIHEQDHLNDSQTLTHQVLAYRKRVFGWRSIQTHEALQVLANTVRDQGRLEEAEEHYRHLLLWVDNAFGKDDVKTYEARWGLANIMSRQRKYSEAEDLYRRNLVSQLDNPIESRAEDTAQAYFNLGCVLWYQGQNEEGHACFHHAYDRRVELFGASDARTVKVLFCLAEIVGESDQRKHAEDLYLLLGQSVELPHSEDEDLNNIQSLAIEEGEASTYAPSSPQ